jgi:putative tributyrin esterase
MIGVVRLTVLNLIEKQLIHLIVLMPSDGLRGDGSGYIAHEEADYERWIMKE